MLRELTLHTSHRDGRVDFNKVVGKTFPNIPLLEMDQLTQGGWYNAS